MSLESNKGMKIAANSGECHVCDEVVCDEWFLRCLPAVAPRVPVRCAQGGEHERKGVGKRPRSRGGDVQPAGMFQSHPGTIAEKSISDFGVPKFKTWRTV